MALLLDAPLTSTINGFDQAQAVGISIDPRGLVSPIPGSLEINTIGDSAGALMSRITPSDVLTYGGIRAEIDYAPEANAERWYVWEVYFPTTFNPSEQLSFMQIHDSPDGGESPIKFPNFEFIVQSGQIYCMVPLNAPDETTSTGRVPAGYRVPAVLGRWVKCVLHANWGTDTSGFLECWYDGKLVAKEWNRPCGYTDAVGPYWKLGLYDFSHSGIATTYTVWYRNAKLYSTGHSVPEILGVTPLVLNTPQVQPILY